MGGLVLFSESQASANMEASVALRIPWTASFSMYVRRLRVCLCTVGRGHVNYACRTSCDLCSHLQRTALMSLVRVVFGMDSHG